MNSFSGCLIAATGLAVSLLAGCGAAAGPAPAPPSPQEPAAAGDLEELFWERLEGSRERFTEADVRFMTDMIVHHAQAIAMSRLVPDRTETRAIRTLAARILNAQEDEIEIIETWLRDREQALPSAPMDGRHPAHHEDMPGMLSGEQMRALEDASGTDFDRLFLTFMIEHHQGAVTMVQELFATDGAAQDPTVFKLGSDVHVDQRTEIARMERLLAELSQRPAPPGAS